MASKNNAGRLYVVATSHLDTQWRWTVRDTIERFLPATLEQSFARFEEYPFFVLSFEGAFRYRLVSEYYPREFERLARYVRRGRWHPAGSMLDAPDVNIVAPESLVRHILYGNRFFERRFGVRSRDLFLPDCFGFSWALPTIARHCGLAGFSSQKMIKWSPPARIPFDLGLWEGPDGSRIVAALRPGGYGEGLDGDPSRSREWIERVRRAGAATGVAIGYRYFGVGDRGGAPDERSIRLLGRALEGGGELEVVHGGSDRLFLDLGSGERERLPVHAGELLLPTHGTGCWTSQLQMKRWNRRCELAADAAERAATLAAWLGASAYPAAELRRAWEGFLWHQMHDDLTGTSIPDAYRLSWNDQLLALNRLATVRDAAVAAAARGLDTGGGGEPLVVYNPLCRRRREPVAARVRLPDPAGGGVRVLDPRDRDVPCQVLRRGDGFVDLLFTAEVPAVGLAVYRVLPAPAPDPEAAAAGGLAVSATTLESRRYRVSVSPRGEVESIWDKELGRELLAGPVELQLLPDGSRRWPAWELRHRDVARRPRRWRGQARVEVAERGPLRAALRIERRTRGSTMCQHLRLHAGDGGAAERLEWACELDWRTRRRILKAAFPLAAASPRATYDLGLGAIQRGVNRRDAYEVPAQRWAGQTADDGAWGVTIFTDAGYGWDKPDEATLRHTLVRSPRARHHYRHQAHQDFGRHRFTLALTAHRGDPLAADASFRALGLQQPLAAFQTGPHPGPLGREIGFLDLAGDGAEVRALKRLEDPGEADEWVVRLAETRGAARRVKLGLGGGVAAAREIDGCERPLAADGGAMELRDARLAVELGRFQPRAFALRASPAPAAPAALECHPLELPWDLAAASFHGEREPPDFDGRGNALPGELLPAELACGEVPFRLGPVAPGAANAMACRGQSLQLPAETDAVFLLAAGLADDDEEIVVAAGGARLRLQIHPYSGFVGQRSRWRQYRGWRLGAERPAYLRPAPVAWAGTHRHGPGVADQAYVFCYLYRYEVPVPAGAGELRLPRAAGVRIFAATAARRGATWLIPASDPLDPVLP